MTGRCIDPPSPWSKWWWSLQSAMLFLLLALPFAFGRALFFGRFRGAPPAAATMVHGAMFFVGVRLLMEQK